VAARLIQDLNMVSGSAYERRPREPGSQATTGPAADACLSRFRLYRLQLFDKIVVRKATISTPGPNDRRALLGE
jgi:hypothetical protein